MPTTLLKAITNFTPTSLELANLQDVGLYNISMNIELILTVIFVNATIIN